MLHLFSVFDIYGKKKEIGMGGTWNKKETKKGRWVRRLRGTLKKCG